MGYLRVATTVKVGDEIVATTPTVDFRGAMNPVLLGALPLAMLFTLWYAWRTGSTARPLERRLGRRQLPAVRRSWRSSPSASRTSTTSCRSSRPSRSRSRILLRRASLPRFVMWGFVVVYLVGFAAYFPFRQIP